MKVITIFEFRGALYIPREHFGSEAFSAYVRILPLRPLTPCRKLISRGGNYKETRFFHYAAKERRLYGEIVATIRPIEHGTNPHLSFLELRKKDDSLGATKRARLSSGTGEGGGGDVLGCDHAYGDNPV